jgi:hypothetical protein
MSAPAWMSKHPCVACGSGYGICSSGLPHGLMCCKACEHPTRWADDPYTSAEFAEMWEGRPMPDYIKGHLRNLRAREVTT